MLLISIPCRCLMDTYYGQIEHTTFCLASSASEHELFKHKGRWGERLGQALSGARLR